MSEQLKPVQIIGREYGTAEISPTQALASLRKAAGTIANFWATKFGGECSAEIPSPLMLETAEYDSAMHLRALLAAGYAVRLQVATAEPGGQAEGSLPFTAVRYADSSGSGDWPVVWSAEGRSLDMDEFCHWISRTPPTLVEPPTH